MSQHDPLDGDCVQRFLLEDLDIRGVIVCLRNSWQRMHAGRDYAPAVRTLLGEMCAVTVLIGSNLKQPGRVTVQTQGDGVVSLLMVECTESLRLRGVARAPHDARGDLRRLLGSGRLVLTLRNEESLGARPPYQSVVPLEGEDVAAVFAHYLAQSVQQPAFLLLAADADNAVGMMLQKLPDADACDADGWMRATQLAATVSARELAALPPLRLLARVFAEENVRVFDPRPVRYHCPEDWDKVRDMLRTLGRSEVEAILREHGEVVIHDDVCNHEYRFDARDIAALFPSGEAPPTLH